MAYKKLELKEFLKALNAGEYENSTAARRAIGKVSWEEAEKNKARKAINTKFGVVETPSKTKPAKPTASTSAPTKSASKPAAKATKPAATKTSTPAKGVHKAPAASTSTPPPAKRGRKPAVAKEVAAPPAKAASPRGRNSKPAAKSTAKPAKKGDKPHPVVAELTATTPAVHAEEVGLLEASNGYLRLAHDMGATEPVLFQKVGGFCEQLLDRYAPLPSVSSETDEPANPPPPKSGDVSEHNKDESDDESEDESEDEVETPAAGDPAKADLFRSAFGIS